MKLWTIYLHRVDKKVHSCERKNLLHFSLIYFCNMATCNNNNNNFYDFDAPNPANFINDFTRSVDSRTDLIESIDYAVLEKYQNEIEDQEKHEFIRLITEENKVTLKEGRAFLSQLENYTQTPSSTTAQSNNITTTTYNLNGDVFVISFLGDTTSGKSFLANQLLNVQSYFDPSEHNISTTANVACYESQDAVNMNVNTSCLALDFEGENASRLPRYLRRLLDMIITPEHIKLRSNAVKTYFPPLAYLLSNVVILIGQDGLYSNSRYIDRVKYFTAQAIDPVEQNSHKPVLILIQNKYPGDEILSPLEATNKFFETNVHANDLNKFFKGVRCFILPFKSKVNTNTYSNTKFDEHIVEFRKLLVVLCNRHQNNLLPRFAWLQLTRQITQNLSDGKPIKMHIILEDVFMKKHGESENIITLYFFRRLYEKNSICSTRWFHYCREFAMNVLARSIALRLPKFECEKLKVLTEKECKNRLNELWKFLDPYRPCEALYMGRGQAKDRNHPVFCYQYKGESGTIHEHQTSEVVFGATWFQRAIRRLGVERPTKDRWVGPFQSSDTTSDNPDNIIYKKLLDMTSKYLNQLRTDPKCIYSTFNELLQKCGMNIDKCSNYINTCFCCSNSILNEDHAGFIRTSIICSSCFEGISEYPRNDHVETATVPLLPVDENECAICMSSRREVMFFPCGHYRYCKSCAEKIFKEFKICSVCKQSVERIQPVY